MKIRFFIIAIVVSTFFEALWYYLLKENISWKDVVTMTLIVTFILAYTKREKNK